ncbi:MAG: glycosyltransferase family 9 protein [Bryobacteraceae bacterium]|nr:glycosyltransferase family 9 protein [Bryobacteraceae bacterium]
MRRLAIRPGAIGDCILTLPALEALDPDEVWVPRPVVPLVQFANRVEALPDTGLDWLAIPGVEGLAQPVLERLAQFDEIVSWYGTSQPEFRAAVAHLPFVFHPALPPPPGVPRIAVPQVPRTRVVVHPFSGSPRKNWPLHRFQALARELSADWAIAPDGAERFSNLYDLACWLGGARLYIGNDSGITHLASAVGTPVVALFGPTDPAVWAPRGAQVEIIKKSQISEIELDDVLAAARRFL